MPVSVFLVTIPTAMSSFLLNLCNVILSLVDKNNRKLFQEGCKGLKESDIFNGKKQDYGNFVKIIKRDLSCTSTMKALKIITKWDTRGSTDEVKRIPTQEGMVDVFKSNKASSKEIKTHCDLVWNTSAFLSDTPRYFGISDTAPVDTACLEDAHNTRKLKHVVISKKLWNSLSSAFKIEIAGSKEYFQCNQESDGPLLWDFIHRRINPTTMVSASKLKDEIKITKASDFDNDVVKYNT